VRNDDYIKEKKSKKLDQSEQRGTETTFVGKNNN
jgi:hypothetical protein